MKNKTKLMNYEQVQKEYFHLSMEDTNQCFNLIIQQCWEILLLAQTYFTELSMSRDRFLIDFRNTFPRCSQILLTHL
ncbi:unnamed protein product [Trichobilharzia szidati]|nr:unnamed protein product [Trichobilharzia szidati]